MKVVPAIFLISLLVFFGSCGPEGPFSENEMTRQDSLEKYQVIAKVNGEDWILCPVGESPGPRLKGHDNVDNISISATGDCDRKDLSILYLKLLKDVTEGTHSLFIYNLGGFTGIYRAQSGFPLTAYTNEI